MNEKKKLQPKVRFREFTGENAPDWEQRKLWEVVDFIGTGKSRYNLKEIGKYEILGSTGIIGYDDNYDYEGNFLLTARVGANAGTIYRYSGKVKITDNTVFLKATQLNFVYSLLKKFDLKSLSFGSGQPLIKSSELKQLKISIPINIEEQQKIGSFFQQFDSLIALHQRN
ncbi:restriction endonuclease subunit S [Enterococcus cecorum]|uniref:restriction endonuclease subunit S n=1 Tax=Enterococcus cecorum TaxID=44008 RepID=UPI003F91F9E9